MNPMAAILETFFQECEEQLGELETGLMAMEAGDADTETVNAVFRAVHSIKGGAGAFALDALVRFAHVFETAMDEVRAGRLKPDAATMNVLLRAADVLADLVRAARDGDTVDETRTQSLAAELVDLKGGTGGDEDDGLVDFPAISFEPLAVTLDGVDTLHESWTIEFRPRAELYAKGNETFLLLRELRRLGDLSVSLLLDDLPELPELDPEGAYLSWTATLQSDCGETAIREVFEFVDTECDIEIRRAGMPDLAGAMDEAAMLGLIRMAGGGAAVASDASPALVMPLLDDPQPAQAKMASEPPAKTETQAAATATIRVDLDRVDRLIDLVGELVINEAMLSQRVLEAGIARASGVATALDELGQLTREIQDSVMAIRAQPVRSVFQRIPRLVRETAAMTGKPVRLVTEGEGTEVDKTVIERLSDPLTHMIRNAIDHGLEAPDARRASGKCAEGVVRLSAFHRSGRIVIEVADDGAGIDRGRVKSKAIERGLIGEDAQLTDDETDNLIFLPGFSTASAVSDLSGRGVGLDVVRRSVQALGGRISIVSRPGEGSTFTLSLPLTLAVLDGMVVTVAGQTLIVPLGTIVETLQPRATQLHGLGGDVRVIAIRGGYLPLIDVRTALGYCSSVTSGAQGVALLVEGEGGVRAVLLVDAIQGQRQVVIKSLEANYRAVPGIAAATVMGDGRVALILDVDVLVSHRRSELTAHEPQLAAGAAL